MTPLTSSPASSGLPAPRVEPTKSPGAQGDGFRSAMAALGNPVDREADSAEAVGTEEVQTDGEIAPEREFAASEGDAAPEAEADALGAAVEADASDPADLSDETDWEDAFLFATAGDDGSERTADDATERADEPVGVSLHHGSAQAAPAVSGVPIAEDEAMAGRRGESTGGAGASLADGGPGADRRGASAMPQGEPEQFASLVRSAFGKSPDTTARTDPNGGASANAEMRAAPVRGDAVEGDRAPPAMTDMRDASADAIAAHRNARGAAIPPGAQTPPPEAAITSNGIDAPAPTPQEVAPAPLRDIAAPLEARIASAAPTPMPGLVPGQTAMPRLDTAKLTPRSAASAEAATLTALGPGPAADPLSDLLRSRDGVFGVGGTQTATPLSSAPHAPLSTAPMPHGAGASAAQQVATIMRNARDGEIEIALSPKELGHVRMVMSQSETGLSLVLFAERNETQELLRRHADLLQDALEQSGRGSVDISFGGSGEDGRRSSETPAAPNDAAKLALTAPPEGGPRLAGLTVATDRLDLRL